MILHFEITVSLLTLNIQIVGIVLYRKRDKAYDFVSK